MKNDNYFYSNIRYLRNLKKMSMNRFAELIDFNVSTISRWENNFSGATIDSAIIISNKLNIPLNDLICTDLSKLSNEEINNMEILDRLSKLSLADKEMINGIIENIENRDS